MCGVDDGQYPKRWKDMSLDLRLMFVYHIAMMALWLLSWTGFITLPLEIVVVALLALAITGLLVWHRKKHDWRWPRIGFMNVFWAATSIVLGAVFLVAATLPFSPLNPSLLPWCAAVGGIFLFNALTSLKVLCLSQQQFLRACHPNTEDPPKPDAPKEPVWKKRVRTIFNVYILAVWLVGVAFFWRSGTAFRDGANAPTPQRTEELSDHGRKVFITPDEMRIVTLLKLGLIVGTPSALLAGAFIHFILRVNLDPRVPMLGRGKSAASTK